MTDRMEMLDANIRKALQSVAGIVSVHRLEKTDGPEILKVEQEAEKRSLMGMGMVVNTGVRDVLACD